MSTSTQQQADRPDQGPEDGATGADAGQQDQQDQQQAFTQADVDRIVADRLKREREATKAKYGDYNDLKRAAEAKKTAEDRIADLEREVEMTKVEALKRHVQATHGISDEDAELFLTGTDEESLTAQAKRLAERDGTRKKKGPVVPGEGHTPNPPKADEKREFARKLFGRDD